MKSFKEICQALLDGKTLVFEKKSGHVLNQTRVKMEDGALFFKAASAGSGWQEASRHSLFFDTPKYYRVEAETLYCSWWMNIYPNDSQEEQKVRKVFATKEIAENRADPNRIACVELTGSVEL